MADQNWTIGELARQVNVSVQTLRHYDTLGLLPPRAKSAGGYRLYDAHDRARLELIRALRDLEVGLDSIGDLLRGALALRDVAELHLKTLDLHARAIERRRAVLRVLLASKQQATPDRLARLQALSHIEHIERERFVAQQLKTRIGSRAAGELERAIVDAASLDLPDSPTEEQVEAWLELAEMVSDPTFLAQHQATANGTARTGPSWRRRALPIFSAADRLAKAGVDPASPDGARLARRFVRYMARQDRPRGSRLAPSRERLYARAVLRRVDNPIDRRESRFWDLLYILKPKMERSPIRSGWPWILAATRATFDRRD